jgi:hypothetical protein
MVYIQGFIMVFGGNNGTEPLNDLWSMNIKSTSYSWSKIDIAGKVPCSRFYHTAVIVSEGRAKGMMIVFGGRTEDVNALEDTWGLVRHRNGNMEWKEAPLLNKIKPIGRY